MCRRLTRRGLPCLPVSRFAVGAAGGGGRDRGALSCCVATLRRPAHGPADGAPRSPPGPLRASGWTRQRWVGRARARFLRHSHVAVLFHGPASRAPRRVPWAGLGESREAHEQSTGNAQAQQTESGGEQALCEDGADELMVELKPRKLEFPGESNDRRAD